MGFRKISDLVLYTDPPTWWEKRADEARVMSVGLVLSLLWPAVGMGLIYGVILGLDPTVERLVDLVATGFSALTMLLLLVLGGNYPAIKCFVRQLADDLKECPAAHDPEDVEAVLRFLRRFAWIHRFACRRQGLDYATLMEGCIAALKASPTGE